MLRNRIFLKRSFSYLKYHVSARRLSQPANESDEIIINQELGLTPLPKKKPQRQPFIKNLFLGEFDKEILTYPEVQTNERQKQFQEWLAPIEEYINRTFDSEEKIANSIPNEVIEQLKESDVFGAIISEEHKGVGLSATEFAKLIEVVSKSPSLASYVINSTDPVALLIKYGNDDQKKRYLPLFATGDLIPTFCIMENNNAKSDLLKATAVVTECGKFWKLNAEKLQVLNGNGANCFFVLANATETDDPLHKPNNPALFIAESTHGGISSSNTIERVGQRALEVCSVTFKDTLIPKENLIDEIESGPKIMMDLMSMEKQNIGSQASAILKRFIDDLTEHAIKREHFGKQLMNYQFAQETIAKMTASLYAIESMTYLTTGLMDQYENQDCSVENAIVERYSARECAKQIYRGLQLVGRLGYMKDSSFERTYRDALALSLFNSSTADLNMYIGLMGLHHVGSLKSEEVKKYRNPMKFPSFILREIFSTSSAPDLGLEEHLHPSLMASAKLLQEAVFCLADSTQTMLVTYGIKVAEASMELRRLAEMAMEIYAMTAVLARSSRAYCIGLRHSDEDIVLAHIVCWNSVNRVKANNRELNIGNSENCDDLYQVISKRAFTQHKYFPEHPLTKNY